jgi:hypothetical protein
VIRQQELAKKRRQRKIEWMRKLYSLKLEKDEYPTQSNISEGKSKKKSGWLGVNNGLTVDEVVPKKAKKKSTPDIDQIMMELESLDPNAELIHWTMALDFEAYHKGWFGLATAGLKTEDPEVELDYDFDYLPEQPHSRPDLSDSVKGLPQLPSTENLFVGQHEQIIHE